MKLNYKNCAFEKSAAQLSGCPESKGEIAFVGRSNAGKSSAMNVLMGQRIARTSKTPGRTQLINFFSIPNQFYLVDLPGYGYAKVALKVKNEWHGFISEYLEKRNPLIGVVIVMDCRHPLQPIDVTMLDYCRDTGLRAHIILTKADKLSKNEQKNTFFKVQKALNADWPGTSLQLFSATKKIGGGELTAVLDDWFGLAIEHHASQAEYGVGTNLVVFCGAFLGAVGRVLAHRQGVF